VDNNQDNKYRIANILLAMRAREPMPAETRQALDHHKVSLSRIDRLTEQARIAAIVRRMHDGQEH
jgi:hypothetical protein